MLLPTLRSYLWPILTLTLILTLAVTLTLILSLFLTLTVGFIMGERRCNVGPTRVLQRSNISATSVVMISTAGCTHLVWSYCQVGVLKAGVHAEFLIGWGQLAKVTV